MHSSRMRTGRTYSGGDPPQKIGGPPRKIGDTPRDQTPPRNRPPREQNE